MGGDGRATSGARVLVCDDEQNLRRMLHTLLKRAGYDVTEAEGVVAARGRIQTADQPYDALLTLSLIPT